MTKLFTVTATSFDKLKRLVVKAWNGNIDTRTAIESSPYGVDSNPVKGMVALYVKSELDGKESIVGYYNKERLAEVGETRVFSTDQSGAFKFNFWLRADGTALLGDSDNPAQYTNFLVKYNELLTEYNKTKTYLTTLKSATLGIATALDGLVPGTSTAFNAAMAGQVVGDFTQAKNEKVKTN